VVARVRNTDVFAGINAALFVIMCIAVYYDRFLQYRGRGNLHEFAIYAGVILSLIAIAWLYFRQFHFRNSMLALVQVGILVHFAGAFVPLDGGRLYDAYIFGIRYDKYVHFYNAFVAAVVVGHVFDRVRAHLPFVRGLAVLLIVLGLGAVVEILEYLVMLTVPNAGVGGYDNNMQDLIGNLLGGTLFVVLDCVRRSRRSRAAVYAEP
jgi:uncharacterized membrane protein YjdF